MSKEKSASRTVVPETSFFRVLNWERYVPYNSAIAVAGTIVVTGAVARIAYSAWENQKEKEATTTKRQRRRSE